MCPATQSGYSVTTKINKYMNIDNDEKDTISKISH